MLNSEGKLANPAAILFWLALRRFCIVPHAQVLEFFFFFFFQILLGLIKVLVSDSHYDVS